MNPAARSQLWLATLGAIVSLGAAVIPATIQLFDENPTPAARAPVENVVTPPVAPATTTPSAGSPSEGASGGGANGRGRGRAGGGGGGGEP